MEITLHGGGARQEPGGEVCRVSFLTYGDFLNPDLDLGSADVVFTDSLAHVRFAGRRGPVHFLESLPEFWLPDDPDAVMEGKDQLLSVLLPQRESWTELAEEVLQQAQALLPEHIYFDDGDLETHAAAMSRYRFSLIVDDGNHTVSLPFIRSLSFHTIAVFNGFVDIGQMVFNGIADFRTDPFDLSDTLATVTRHNEHLGALWHYQRILQDQMLYRYNRPFEERLSSQACTLCRLRLAGLAPDGGGRPPLAFVGVYSARGNFAKRRAVRETWGRVLQQHGMRYTFFLGAASAGSSLVEMRVRREQEQHGDLVFLDVVEGYRMNSQKGLLFLEWIALRSEAEFLLKVDDDVYWRPAPLLELLQLKPPAQYAWGFFDYISPIPDDPDDNFHNSMDDFPFEVFPPYPRGVVRVLSMDVVRLIARASQEGRLRIIFGDDPCIGVHLRQLLYDERDPLPSLTLDDFDNKVFAMEPSCHPNLWSRMTNRTWVVHHVSPEQIHCMWETDLRAGYYTIAADGVWHDDSTPLTALPDLCSCAPDVAFEERTDLDDIRRQTDRILADDG